VPPTPPPTPPTPPVPTPAEGAGVREKREKVVAMKRHGVSVHD
jgi:hypothetical protein